MKTKVLELLAPAKNLESGKAAINYGADAVYMGAPAFGARQAASNPIADVESLAAYAHRYGAKVYATLNTLLFDEELAEAQKMTHELWNAGIDALIIQDMAFLEMDLPPVPLFASTQTHNFDVEKILFLEKCGFQRVILARELTLSQIEEIRGKTKVELECFVHGALCVSLSGQCYLSEALWKRSANRGACAQPCRLPYTLKDKTGQVLMSDKHLLSLKDINQSAFIPSLINAGITSFKIEGRLKDISYVKNITAHYRNQIDSFLESHSGFAKASAGKVLMHFSPQPERSFNRGFSNYFLDGEKGGLSSPHTPKSLGQYLGKVIKTDDKSFWLETSEIISNGDGLCFFNIKNELTGIKVNRAEGNRLFPLQMNGISKGNDIYRNSDVAFDKLLEQDKTRRLLSVDIQVLFSDKEIQLIVTDEQNNQIEQTVPANGILAENQQAYLETIKKQFSKTGDFPFLVNAIVVKGKPLWFYPVSALNAFRRELLENLLLEILKKYSRKEIRIEPNTFPYPIAQPDFRINVVNKLAKQFYTRHGLKQIPSGFETESSAEDKPMMETRYCILGEWGMCKLKNPEVASMEPLYLEFGGGRLQIQTDCKNCRMKLFLK